MFLSRVVLLFFKSCVHFLMTYLIPACPSNAILQIAMPEPKPSDPLSPKFNWDIAPPMTPKSKRRARPGNFGEIRLEKGDLHLRNQLPSWNPDAECLVMKFWNNRIRASSSKNYIVFKAQDLEAEQQVDFKRPCFCALTCHINLTRTP